MNLQTLRSLVITCLIFVAVIFIGVLVFNQAVSLYYKADLELHPCQLCMKYNPEWEACYNQFNQKEVVNISLPFMTNKTIK